MRNLINFSKAIFFSVGLVALSACSDPATVQEEVLRSVRLATVVDASQSRSSTFPGVSRSARESRLSFKVAGTLTNLYYKVGDEVAAGEVIAELDPSSYQLQLQQAQANVSQARASLRNASAAYERTRNLYATNNASLGELESARAASESANAQYQSALKSLELAELNLSYTRLTVDVACVIDAILVEVNENVSTASEVARVNCSDDLEIEITVPESVVTTLRKDLKAQIRFDAVDDRYFAGYIDEIGTGVSGTGSTFPVTVALAERDSALRPGLAASVSFVFSAASGMSSQTLVPLTAVVKRTDGTYVFVVQRSADDGSIGTAVLRRVSPGKLTSAGLIIDEGLVVDEQVITAGVSFLRDGMRVKLN